jgi:hypothetical protein
VRGARAERGQATVEAVALWLIIAVVGGLLLLDLPRLGNLVAGMLDGGDRAAARKPAAAALAERALAGRGGRGGTPTLLAAERLLALDLGAAGAHDYLAARLLARYGSRLGHALDATSLVGGAQAPGDRLIATPAARPRVVIARLADEPLPDPDAATRRALIAAGGDASVAALDVQRRTAPLGRLLGRVQTGQAVIGLLAPADEVGPAPGRRGGDAVLCEPVDLRWTMGGVVHARPLARALHVVVVRAGRVIDERLLDGERCP